MIWKQGKILSSLESYCSLDKSQTDDETVKLYKHSPSYFTAIIVVLLKLCTAQIVNVEADVACVSCALSEFTSLSFTTIPFVLNQFVAYDSSRTRRLRYSSRTQRYQSSSQSFTSSSFPLE